MIPKIADYLSSYYKVPWQEGGWYEHILPSMDQAGVEKAIVFSVATKSTQVHNVNSFMAELPRDRIIPFGALHQDYADYKEEVRRIRELGLKGVKFHPEFQNVDVDDIRMMRIYEAIGDTLPIIIHLGDETSQKSSPTKMEKVLKDMPYLRVIGAHFGGYQSWEESMEHLVGRNIWLETSSSLHWLSQEDAMKMIKEHGEDRFFFGTDYPMVTHKDELAAFMKLPLTEEQRKKILSENIIKFLDIE